MTLFRCPCKVCKLRDNQTACFHGDIQLVNDNNVNNIVEFCYKGDWRRICVSDTWGNVEANIVCSQLGYSDQGATTSNVSISQNSPYTFLRFVDCDESDANIDECYYEARNGCNMVDKHATVQCSSANCADRDIRLVGGATDNEGRVEMCTDRRWMAICSNASTEQDAGQMCQEFRFASIGAEVLVFNPRRVPTINCTIGDSGDLSCNESCDDGTTDLGIRCVRQEVLNQISTPCDNVTSVYNSTIQTNQTCEFSCDYCNTTASPSVSHVQGNAMSTDTVTSIYTCIESSCGTESSTTALGVIVALLVALLVVLLIVCGVMWNRISQKHKQICMYVVRNKHTLNNSTTTEQPSI
ncbi:scavenger receptor cysteine-rich domain superfamily protein-like isoform X2 [Halichondria panicea]|uniref:scavenger receptor cysteine-rich domain superfamily protein-like isoform X2 n=1 Tax=Halichondria panicea TaxID=6063 RepID=UPI00312B355D